MKPSWGKRRTPKKEWAGGRAGRKGCYTTLRAKAGAAVVHGWANCLRRDKKNVTGNRGGEFRQKIPPKLQAKWGNSHHTSQRNS